MKPWHFIVLLALIGCDYTTMGSIENRSGSEIEIVVSPYLNESYQLLHSTLPEFVRWDTLNSKGYFRIPDQQELTIASGINSFVAAEIPYDQIEVRTEDDTTLFETKPVIRQQFVETKNHFYVWRVE